MSSLDKLKVIKEQQLAHLYKGPDIESSPKLQPNTSLNPAPDTMACCSTSSCGFPSCSTSGTCDSSCCQPNSCQTSYGIGGGIGGGQEGGYGAVSYRTRWCRPDCRVEGTSLSPCCVVSCIPPSCCELHQAQASCCRPSYCGQSCCHPACCCQPTCCEPTCYKLGC
ncbi:hypothetical protein HPG69_006754 [Diceros bicornis minor]|uniref:Uncharacterized protein n=1 Tax=Diceros bicornis minor TaxID=77932 RepID=A0A7J7F238_DICBM|nr:hypothetical protein HPG69_006754 [Diceros bicornis minor]